MVETSKTPAKSPEPAVEIADPVAAPEPQPVVGDVPDPRTGRDFTTPKGYAGLHEPDAVTGGLDYVDPANLPVEVTPGVQPDAGGDALLAAAQAKAPNLTAEFVKAYKFTPEMLADIARGSVPPPPAIGPAYTADLYLTPAGWQQTAPGVAPGQSTAISR